jgi:hypothetical protein
MGSASYNTALIISFIVTTAYSLFVVSRWFPEHFHRITGTQSCVLILFLGIVNSLTGSFSGLICGSLFPFGDMYSPITGSYAGFLGGLIGHFVSLFAWSAYSKQYLNKKSE